MQEPEQQPSRAASENSDQGTSRVVTADGSAEGTGEHKPFQRQAHHPCTFCHNATRSRKEICHRDAQRLRKKAERIHARLRPERRSSRRTSGTETAIAMMTAACKTSTMSLGTSALIARPP